MSEQLSFAAYENIMETVSKCGSWNERGLLASLDRKGFTPNKCFMELMANSTDAQATMIVWKITSEYIKLVDDGIGMDYEKLEKMFDMFRANNGDRKTMGVSGLGGKEGMYILSKKENKEPTTVILYTHSSNGDYWKAIVPWKEIIDEKIYTGKILISKMTAEEITNFIDDRENFQFKHGTTICFEYNDNIKNLIENAFDTKIINKEKISQNNRWEFVFGHSNPKFILEKSDGSPIIELTKYDYFSGTDMEFYIRKQIDHIFHYIDDKNNDRYIYISDDGNLEIQTHGKNGYKTDPKEVTIHQSWKHIGTYEIRNGMRIIKDLFDPHNPKTPHGATMHLNLYDQAFFQGADVEYIKECLSGCSVYRNEQLITKINFADGKFNSSTSRAGVDSMIDKFYHRTEIHYSTISTQDNRMDMAMGIQENKNQHQNVLPKPLERLITHIKSNHLDKIRSYFDEVIELKYQQEKKKRALETERLRLIAEQKKIEEEKKRIEEEKRRLEELEEDSDDDFEYDSEEEKEDVGSQEEKEDDPEEEKEDDPEEEKEDDPEEEKEDDPHEEKEDDPHEEKEHDSPKSLQVEVENLQQKIAVLRAKLLEKINSENDYDKMQKIYELISNL